MKVCDKCENKLEKESNVGEVVYKGFGEEDALDLCESCFHESYELSASKKFHVGL